MAAGCLVYHGPREQVVPFFELLGFRLPPRKGTADFLQEITSKKDQQVRSRLRGRSIAKVLLLCAICCIILLCVRRFPSMACWVHVRSSSESVRACDCGSFN